jgi:hypothetical protein
MRPFAKHPFRTNITLLLLASGMAVAQTAPPAGGWRRVGDPPPARADSNTPAPTPAQSQGDPTEPVARDAYGQPVNPPVQNPDGVTPPPAIGQQSAPPQANTRPAYGLPAQLTIKPGTYATIRVNEMLASNKNKVGDLFTGTLAQPLVVDGVVVAARGQNIVGRVAEVGKDKDGVHRLGLELTGITLADGTQAPLQSKLVTTQGRTTPGGVQAGTIAGTTAVGAGIGAAAGWGTGAAIGAGAGAAVGIAGVLATRNHPSVVYPESALTFEVTSPVLVSTANAPQAFRYVGPEDYSRPQMSQVMRPVRPAPVPAYPYYGPGYYSPYYYAPYPYYWGPSFGFGIGIGRGWGRRW